ncbi:unpaired-like protein [Lasius niger]|uniref:Unpaired-like protein n=1 Tax=Lasius niger TaxID=67767 RepID=A0A0J7KT98_LASNI|nr:unpaired-like protein [Lasius niger]
MLIKKHYDWLPSSIPKELGETLNQEYLQTLDLDEELVKTYEFMQLYAMGLEQMVWDQEILGIKFATDFKECEFKLRSVLCEIQNAIMERGIMPRPNVNRDRMPPEYRADDLRRDTTCRITRDWVIFRDYMNGLEYVKEVFAYLRSRYIQSNQI